MPDASHCSFQRGLKAISAKDRVEVQTHLETLAGRIPFLTGASKPSGLRIMTFRSLRHARLGTSADGLVGLKIPEGHFSTRFFLNSIQSQRITANVFGNNLNRHSEVATADVAINTISCPDLHAEDLDALAGYLALNSDLPVVNPPHIVKRTGRFDMAQTLRGIAGLRVPRTVRFKLYEAATAIRAQGVLTDIHPPVILRIAGTHTGRTACLVRRRADLPAVLKGFPPCSTIDATEFVDARRGEKLFTKYRAFFIDGRLYPVARLVSNSWSVHSGDRYRVMFALQDAQQQEQAFLADPEGYLGQRATEALHEVQARVLLDFFGIDFAIMPSGEVLMFEVNAVMRHNYDHAKTFPYTRLNLDRISAAFDEMVLNRIGSPVVVKT